MGWAFLGCAGTDVELVDGAVPAPTTCTAACNQPAAAVETVPFLSIFVSTAFGTSDRLRVLNSQAVAGIGTGLKGQVIWIRYTTDDTVVDVPVHSTFGRHEHRLRQQQRV